MGTISDARRTSSVRVGMEVIVIMFSLKPVIMFSYKPVSIYWLLDKLAGKTTDGIQLRGVKEADHEFLDTSRLIGSQTLPNRLKGSNETIRLDVWVWGNEGSPSWDQSVGLL